MRKPSTFISFLSDYGFKVTFGDESDTLFLRKSLQALIGMEAPVQQVTFLSNEFVGLTKEGRSGLYDLICEDEHGNTFIVEMQLGRYKNFMQRLKFYAFQKFSTLVNQGDFIYKDLKKIYCIAFLEKNIFPESKEYYHYGTLQNQNGEEMDSQITYLIVEISKFEKRKSEVATDLEKLIYIMKNLENFKDGKELPEFAGEGWISRAIEKLHNGRMTAEQRMFYAMTIAREAAKEQMWKESIDEAMDKGMREGMEKMKAAKDREMEEKTKKAEKKAAKKAKKKTLKMAKKLKARGMSDTEIAEITELTIEEVENLD